MNKFIFVVLMMTFVGVANVFAQSLVKQSMTAQDEAECELKGHHENGQESV